MTTIERATLDSGSVELAARALGSVLRDAAAEANRPELLAMEADRLRRTVMQSRPVHKPRSVARSFLRVALAAAALMGFAFVVGYIVLNRSASPIWVEAQVGRGESSAAFSRVGVNHLVTPEVGATQLRFSDGSKVTVERGARLRIQELFSTGATLFLDKGRASVRVVHRDHRTRWSIVAGPFSVAVTGTRFDIAWSPVAERLIVELQEGRVEISGPKLTSPVTLMSGQRFEVVASVQGWSVTPLGADSSSTIGADATEPRPMSSVNLTDDANMVRGDALAQPKQTALSVRKISSFRSRGTTNAAPASGSANAAGAPEGRQWAKLVASGEFRQVTREADTMGLMICLSQCSPSDLRALADASRYTGRLDTAEAALRVLHDRFPSQANAAAYLLGVVDEARGRNTSALRWYEEYLSRASTGSFVGEARAARLRMLVATGGSVAARDAARLYLEQYPQGSAARLATKVLEGR